jgi:pimeloyl-ACP methyl ester carboxylesterase
MRAADAAPRLGELAGVPTLVVNGAHDPIAPPRAGRALAAGIPGSRYVEQPDASHGMPIHQPGLVNALLLDHLAAAEAREPRNG